ncbi:MAG: NAD(P)/FAD-dependent oxidoreductase, partial [Thiothrix sp.]|nr:NAD(P)/FAD-dependent oxidoreductase [Thiothrix sp.]
IGAGPAGVIAAETLHKRMPQADIVLIGDEPEPPYSRMALPYHLIGNIGESGTYLRKTEGYYEQLGIELLQRRVTNLNPAQKQLMLDNGNTVSFDRLLLATGSYPVKPPVEGMDLPGVVNCWTLADARQIIAGSRPGDDVVLMGAGFIGCIILEALARRGINLTVVEMENRMVPRMMDGNSGTLLKQWCEAKGVRVLTSTRVTGVTQENGRLRVHLDGRDPIPVNLLISATGVRPAIDLAKGVLECRQGIVVNEHLQTSHADIYAAGDVAEGRDFSTGGYSVQAIQPTAVQHGALAAANMSGAQQAIHRGSINMNVLDTMGLISGSFGLWQGADGGDSVTLNNPAGYRYMNLQFEADVLVGANTLGLTQHVGVLRGLIQSRTRLGRWKNRLMEDPTRVMEAYLAHHVP